MIKGYNQCRGRQSWGQAFLEGAKLEPEKKTLLMTNRSWEPESVKNI